MNAIQKSLCVALAVSCASCDFEEQPLADNVSLDLPGTPYVYEVSSNDHIATLGRVLFYDRQLSLNNSISCASCHKQNLAFADNVAFTEGFEGKRTLRNSMPIQNLAVSFFMDSLGFNPDPGFFTTLLFWDGRETQLQQMVLKPIVNHIEMGIRDLDDLSAKLEGLQYYQDLFKKAYGDTQVSSGRIAEALSHFLLAIKANKTKFDQSIHGMMPLNAIESLGSELFVTTYECNSCHQVQDAHGYLFQGGAFANIGLQAEYEDDGLAEVTGNASDKGKFKIPSLRNVALTAPYMHDGRFETLDDVLDHYSEGVQDHPNLDPKLRDNNGNPIAMEIPQSDKEAIIAFLNTLTDYDMVTDQRFANPFKTN